MAFYALTILIGSTLLFLVEPMIARYILPWFGGGPSVWSACMLFFQIFLLGGYAYAHYAGTRLTPRRQAMVHGALLLISLCFLPITPSESWKPLTPERPELRIILLLLATIGLPFALLSSSAPLHQYWFSRNFPGRSPYRLYALSNVGSVLGLMLYPFLLEPMLTLRAQTLLWSGAYSLFILSSGACAWRLYHQAPAEAAAQEAHHAAAAERVEWWRPVMWILLSACGSIMLLACTNRMCQEVAVIPFLWIVPLALYLLSFILCFESERWYQRYIWAPLLVAAAGGVLWLLNTDETVHILVQVGLLALTLFACCMVCHGELVRLKPHASRLTGFYLMVSVGGALGGLFVSLAAPHIFSSFWEFHIGLFLTFLLFGLSVALGRSMSIMGWRWVIAQAVLFVGIFLYFAKPQLLPGLSKHGILPVACALPLGMAAVYGRRSFDGRLLLQSGVRALWVLCLVALGFYLVCDVRDRYKDALVTSRNFYGVLSVTDGADSMGERVRSLWHGPIEHGNQYLDEGRHMTPSTYYTPASGIYAACHYHPGRKAAQPAGLNVGVVGLGTGTLASMAAPGDHFRFYEINPEIIRIASDFFYYLKECPAEHKIVLGDARISLERELAQNAKGNAFDVLALDAFNGDAVPVHLLTREAFELYWRHLRPDGILAVNISNLHLDLAPVVRGLAATVGKKVVIISNNEDAETGAYATDWALVTSNERFLNDEAVTRMASDPEKRPRTLVWTDQYSNLLSVLYPVQSSGGSEDQAVDDDD